MLVSLINVVLINVVVLIVTVNQCSGFFIDCWLGVKLGMAKRAAVMPHNAERKKIEIFIKRLGGTKDDKNHNAENKENKENKKT